MKKLLLLFLAATLSFSCSSNDDQDSNLDQGGDEQVDDSDGNSDDATDDNNGDDNNDDSAETSDDTIVGVWKLVKVNGQDVSDCEKKDSYNFTNDGGYVLEDYKETNGNCEEDTSSSHNGYWQKNDNGTYNFRKHGYTGNGSDLTITFEENNTLLTFDHNKYTFKKQ